MESDNKIINLILVRQKMNYLEKLINKTLTKIILNDFTKTDNEENEYKIYKLTDLLDYIGTGKSTTNNNNKGAYPIITTLKTNNGIHSYIDTYEFDDDNLFTIGRGNGVCFIQHGKFSAIKDVYVFKPKDNFNYEILQKIINEELSKLSVERYSINIISNLKLRVPLDLFLTTSEKDYVKEPVDSIFKNIEEAVKKYYEDNSIENIELIKFSDIFTIFKLNSSVKIINRQCFNFDNNLFKICLPGESINSKTLYFKSNVDYINIEKTIYLMNEFIKFKDNIDKNNISELLVPVYFITDSL